MHLQNDDVTIIITDDRYVVCDDVVLYRRLMCMYMLLVHGNDPAATQ